MENLFSWAGVFSLREIMLQKAFIYQNPFFLYNAIVTFNSIFLLKYKGFIMKKLFGFCGVAVLCFTLFSCASSKVPLSDIGSTSILAVVGSSAVPYYEMVDGEYVDNDGLINQAVNAVFGQDNPEITGAKDRVDLCVDTMELLLEENAGLTVIPKDTLVNSNSYKEFSNDIFGFLETYVYATDYKKITELNGKKARILMNEIGSNSLITAKFDFYKYLVDGSKLKGNIGAYLDAEFCLYDKTGKLIIQEEVKIYSTDKTEVSLTKYDNQVLCDMFPELIEQAVNTFIVNHL